MSRLNPFASTDSLNSAIAYDSDGSTHALVSKSTASTHPQVSPPGLPTSSRPLLSPKIFDVAFAKLQSSSHVFGGKKHTSSVKTRSTSGNVNAGTSSGNTSGANKHNMPARIKTHTPMKPIVSSTSTDK